jgi:hypothetical protein
MVLHNMDNIADPIMMSHVYHLQRRILTIIFWYTRGYTMNGMSVSGLTNYDIKFSSSGTNYDIKFSSSGGDMCEVYKW